MQKSQQVHEKKMEHSFNKQPMAQFNHTLHKKKEGVKTQQGSTSLGTKQNSNRNSWGHPGEIKHRSKITLENEKDQRKKKLGVWV